MLISDLASLISRELINGKWYEAGFIRGFQQYEI